MIYDVKTKNISFLKMSKVLRDRGVKNNKFMLTLLDESIQGIDPYRKDLTAEQKVRIYNECCKNIWYFIREVVKIPVDGADIHYIANLGNITLTYLRSLNQKLILVLPRQHGKTLGQVVFDVWNLCFVTTNSNAVYMNKGKADAIKNLKLFKDVKDLLPPWMKETFICDPKHDIDNQESKLIFKRNNTLKVVAPGADPEAADKAGRGLTVANIVLDELAFMKYNNIIYGAAAPAYSKASENAKNNGTPYGITISTTPNNIDEGTPGAFCYKMVQDAAKWSVDLFDLSVEDLKAYVHANSLNDFFFVKYTYIELGRDDKWLEEQRRSLGNDELLVKREILLVWPHSTEGAVFNEEQLSRVYAFIKPPKTTLLVFNQYPITFYEDPDTRLNYILSCDVSGGLSNDNSVITIIHPEDFRIVGDFRSPKIDTDNFRRLIEELMTLYFPKAVLVIEKTGIGSPLIDTLMKNPAIEPRMYREDKERPGEKTISGGFTVRRKTKTTIYGVDTTKQTRDQMMDLLFDIVENEYDKLCTDNIYSDLVNLERKRNNKIEHAAGRHDDSLMSYLIFRWAVFYGKCFRDRFHISPVPSRANVRLDEESLNMNTRVTSVLNTAQNAEINSGFYDSDVYTRLVDQQNRLAAESENASKVDAFMRISRLNGDDWND